MVKKHFEISNKLEELSISYQASVNFTDEEQLTSSFKMALEKPDQEICSKRILVSALIEMTLLSISMVWTLVLEAKGQHRSLVLSIKLAEIELMESITNESPILLLDDVMSELDNTTATKITRNHFSIYPNLYYNNKFRPLTKLARKPKYFQHQNGRISVNPKLTTM